jgi:hypothetical protein
MDNLVAFKRLKSLEDHSVTSYLLLDKKIPYSVVSKIYGMAPSTYIRSDFLLHEK